MEQKSVNRVLEYFFNDITIVEEFEKELVKGSPELKTPGLPKARGNTR